MGNPRLGEQKKSALSYLGVYKFKMAKQLALLGYSHEDGVLVFESLTFALWNTSIRKSKGFYE
ncbi:type II toxin-antitoxin system RelE/ParE family toxin [uncultured Paraglaciecola sp.]|uniref:type II toxin-antitoxin system RelE/ParE family toxin n=1 Tax=uncultured Paraglaciecola sp. TaxID=1765024 RepID=UPI0030DDAEE6